MISKKLLTTILFSLFAVVTLWGQSSPGELQGVVRDENGEPLPGATVTVNVNGQVRGVTTNEEGRYTIKPLPAGSYDVTYKFLGYPDRRVEGITITGGRITTENVTFGEAVGITTGEVEVVRYTKKLIEPDNNTTGAVVTREEIRNLPTRSVNAIAATAGGTYSSNGSTPNIKGGRSDATRYYVDGVQVRGSLGLPQGAIEQMQVITGGVPAEFGDATGGFINITTRGPSSKFAGGVEGITSQFLDPFGYNLVEANVTGPIIQNKDNFVVKEGDTLYSTRLGFFLAGNFNYVHDRDPSAIGIWQVNDETLESLKQNPLRPSPFGAGFVPRAEFATRDQMDHVKTHNNLNRADVNISGKVDYQPVDNFNITVGGQVGYSKFDDYIYQFQLFNSDNNPIVTDQTYRGYVRFRQDFNRGQEDNKDALIKNAYYYIQADYTKRLYRREDNTHLDDFFNYGYYGKFERYEQGVYIDDTINVNGQVIRGNIFQSYQDTLVVFTPAGKNPVTENYTKRYFELNNNDVTSFTQIRGGGGLLNGEQPQIVNSLWSNVGTNWNLYQKFEQDQFNILASASGDVGRHAIKFGLQYEQRVERFYGLNASRLWVLMRQYTNEHIQSPNTSMPIPVYDDEGVYQDTINFPRLNSGSQKEFDRNFRNYLISIGATDMNGRPIDEQSLIQIDRYEPEHFNLGMFGANDLLLPEAVSYYGYDYEGNKLSRKPSLNDFFNNDQRLLAPYNPIYVAGYIEDKFQFRDLIFRLGLRVDRFDANQPVLKDPFSLYPTRTAGEVSNLGVHPDNIRNNYVVYGDDPFSPTEIVGYRNANRWFDASGNEVTDPAALAVGTRSGRISPYLVAPNSDARIMGAESFKDYEPQINVMPRVSFSFPISDEALFFANYDVLTQRPMAGNIGNMDNYLFLENRATTTISNPALQPERRINYELGFKQKLSSNTALTIQAFYGEIRNMVQLVRINYAYPIDYTTYDNIDFGTVKGITLGYDFRRIPGKQNLQMQLNYTLQFAEGTGSSATSGAGLVNSGQPNLRIPVPLSYDVRHNIVAVLDYRYGSGRYYNGPMVGETPIFANTGINFLINARSGEPYTKQKEVTQDVSIGVAQRRVLSGEINGSRLPWQFRLDTRIDRDINLNFTRNEEGQRVSTRGNTYLNVYLWVQNVLNTDNIVRVYQYTGAPDDDGFISSAEGRQTMARVNDPLAFADQYMIKVNNPTNYASPRLVRLGVILNF